MPIDNLIIFLLNFFLYLGSIIAISDVKKCRLWHCKLIIMVFTCGYKEFSSEFAWLEFPR